MSDFYIGQVLLAGFNFAPKNFAACNGQIAPIAQNTALFSLLGTQFGGNGSTTFALPDLRGRTPIGFSLPLSMPVGQAGGSESVPLASNQLPFHTHRVNASTAPGDNRVPVGGVHAAGTEAGAPVNLYGPMGNAVPLHEQSLGLAGSGQAHPNMQPYAVINFCIALAGLYPLRP